MGVDWIHTIRWTCSRSTPSRAEASLVSESFRGTPLSIASRAFTINNESCGEPVSIKTAPVLLTLFSCVDLPGRGAEHGSESSHVERRAEK